jgi:hypothetical protein
MTSEAILEYPAFFDPEMHHMEDIFSEYIKNAIKYEEKYFTARSHMYKSLFNGLSIHTDLREDLNVSKEYDEMIKI